ncbi:hypothetical protein T4E_1043 [Trichinella pseudospiralis]|uniref:Secreted protein n=1 Tax=Trichinella pseudospiralis TaxID=6337 RepID=A0A0V0Y963_TRIPS|nr:hypothetical protein T4E_1043 [Trichinella pseudospiralis]
MTNHCLTLFLVCFSLQQVVLACLLALLACIALPVFGTQMPFIATVCPHHLTTGNPGYYWPSDFRPLVVDLTISMHTDFGANI